LSSCLCNEQSPWELGYQFHLNCPQIPSSCFPHWVSIPSCLLLVTIILFSFLKQEKFGKKQASGFQLFASPSGQKDLLFKESAIGFVRVPQKVDVGLYLTFSYTTSIQNLNKSKWTPGRNPRVLSQQYLWVGDLCSGRVSPLLVGLTHILCVK
jgi:hypothetical protein